jgi:hypothetical protein
MNFRTLDQRDAAVSEIRRLKAFTACNGDLVAMRSFARERWGHDAAARMVVKSDVSGAEDADLAGGNAVDFSRAVTQGWIATRLPGVVTLPARVSMMTPLARLFGTVTAEGRGIPLLPATYQRQQITERKSAAMTVVTKEAWGEPLVEEAISSEVLSAAENTLNLATIDGSTGSLTHGVTPIDSSVSTLSDMDAAIKGALDAIAQSGGNVASVAILAPSWLAMHLGMIRGTSGDPAYPRVGATGGSIAGIQVVVWDDPIGPSTDLGELVIVDGSQIAISAPRVELTTSMDAMVEMSTAPAGDSITPTAASVVRVGMFEADALAVKSTIRAGLVVRRSGAVQTVTGITL